MLSYGDECSAFLGVAKQYDATTVFLLHSLGYHNAKQLENADFYAVPSAFAASFYYHLHGIHCELLPNILQRERVVAKAANRKYITIVNPSREKGGCVFANIVYKCGIKNSPIKFLAVESRGSEIDLAGCGLDLRSFGNIRIMDHTTDPRKFWSLTKICLVPSLVEESQGLVALEAMLNGIPVIVSDRGALPETVGNNGFVLSLPRLLSCGDELPEMLFDVDSWVTTIEQLLYNTTLYDEKALLAKEAAMEYMDGAEKNLIHFVDKMLQART